MWPGFESDDFFAFEQTDVHFRIQYIKDYLHPRLRTLGDQIRKSFLEKEAIALRCQLRSGRWYLDFGKLTNCDNFFNLWLNLNQMGVSLSRSFCFFA
jgi:hypothetical protein